MIPGADTVYLSRHFTLGEMTRTGCGLKNEVEKDRELASLIVLCTRVLQPIRDHWGPLVIISGYRCKKVNDAVGGAPRSQHLRGEAADFRPELAGVLEVYRWILAQQGLLYGQIILEAPPGRRAWIHITLPTKVRRLQALTWDGKKYAAWKGKPPESYAA